MLGSDDADLLFEQALAGNESGVADLFEHYRPRLKRLVLLRMHPQLNARVDASDVLQETFIEMARRLPAYAQDRRMSFFLWLRWLTTERLHQLHRKHLGAEMRTVFRELTPISSAMPDGSVFNIASQLAGDFTSVDRNLIREEVHRKLLDALDQMDSKDREIVGMRHFEELSTEEIAEVLQLSRSGVLKRYMRAIRRLRDVVFADQDLQTE
jgi:RNA polymerase sigma-70 factor (ECF subfamily)